jgi:hypothetical protein
LPCELKVPRQKNRSKNPTLSQNRDWRRSIREKPLHFATVVREAVAPPKPKSGFERARVAKSADAKDCRMLRLSFIEAFARGLSFGTSHGDERLTRTNLFDAKIALNRLSQILRYASSIQLLD